MNSSIATQQVVLQENGIIRDGKGNFLGRIVEDFDGLCREHYRRGRESGLREALAGQTAWELVGRWDGKHYAVFGDRLAPDFCNIPLYAALQSVNQEKRPQNCGTGYCSCIECSYKAEQIERDPVIPAFLRRPGSFGHE